MPLKKVIDKAHQDAKEGKSPSTQAGEFVREEMNHVGEADGPKSSKQAIAIGLSEARKEGIGVPPNPNKAKKKKK